MNPSSPDILKPSTLPAEKPAGTNNKNEQPVTVPLENIRESSDDIRAHVRIQLKSFVTIIKNNERISGLIRDISLGGVSIGVVGNYQPEDKIEMTFKLSNNSTFRNIKGIVKYIEKSRFESITTKHNIIMGVEFVDLLPEKSRELVNFVNNELTK